MLKIFGVAGALAISSSLLAVPTLQLTQTAGVGTGATSGPILSPFAGAVGAFTNVTVGTVLGTPTIPQLSLFNLSTTTGAVGGTIQIAFSEIGFSLPVSSATGSLQGQLNAFVGSGGSVVFDVFLDVANTLFGGSGVGGASSFAALLSTSTSAVVGTGGTAITDYAAFGGPLGPYSLTIVATVTQGAFASNQAQTNYAQVPEPGFYGALGVGLSGLLFFVRRKQSSGSLS